MKFSYFFLFVFLFLLVVPIVSAQEDPTFRFNRVFDLKRPCFDNGFFCSSTSVCNASLIYPDGNILIDNTLMTFNNSFYNVTVSQNKNNQLGFIRVIQTCNNGSDAGAETYDVAITADGKKAQNFPTQFSVILFSFVLVASGLLVERLRLFQTIGSMLMMIMGVITLYPGYSFINYSTLMGKGIGFSLLGMGFYFLIEHSFSRDDQDNKFKGSETKDDLFDF